MLLSGGGDARASCWLLEEASLGGAGRSGRAGTQTRGEALPECPSLGQAEKAPAHDRCW